MMATRVSLTPEARELRACGLAAIAEAGIVALPVHLVVSESGGAVIPLRVFVPSFVALYLLGALLACRFRASGWLPTGAAVAATVAGIAAGQGELQRTVFMVLVAMAVAFRVVTLGVRDWRSPLHAEIGWFAVALAFEAAIASGPEPGWRPYVAVIVPVFFVASLASRATTVWSGGGVGDLEDRVRASWIRRAVIATLALVGVMALAVALSVRGGAFDRVGQALTPAADRFASFVGWSLGQASRPFFWLVDRLGIDPAAVREFFDRLREGGLGDRVRDQVARPEAALWQRLLGLFVFVAIGYAVFRAIRRLRPSTAADERAQAPVQRTERPLDAEVAEPAPPAVVAHELPADRVRRWYAESLLALRARSVAKSPSSTPGEFVVVVAEAYPTATAGFERLTRAYEDVRYGNLRLDDGQLAILERDVRTFIGKVGSSPAASTGDPGDSVDSDR